MCFISVMDLNVAQRKIWSRIEKAEFIFESQHSAMLMFAPHSLPRPQISTSDMRVIKTYFGAVVVNRCDVSTCYDRSWSRMSLT